MKLIILSLLAASLFAGEPSQRIQSNGLDVLVISNLPGALAVPGSAATPGEQMVQVIASKELAADPSIIGWTVTYTASLASGTERPVTLLLVMDADRVAGTFVNLGATITAVSDLSVSPIFASRPLLVQK